MRKRGFLPLAAAVLLTFGGTGIALGDPVISIGYPGEGATWEKGMTYHVDFTTSACAGPARFFMITLVPYGGPTLLIHDGSPLASDGFHSVEVTVPTEIASVYHFCAIVVQVFDSEDGHFAAARGTDYVVYVNDPLPSHIRVTNPSAYGIRWARGSDQTITWTTSGDPVSAVRVDLVKGQTYQHLSENAPNTGSFAWHVPADQEIRSDYLIGVTAVGNEPIVDYSDSPFAVVPPGQESVITVDGYKDAFYSLLTGAEDGMLLIPSCACNDNGAARDKADVSVTIWTAWDADWLYVYEEAADDTVSASSVNRWEEDCLELYVDPLPNDPTVNSIWNARLTALTVQTPGALADDNLNTVADESKQLVRRIIPGGYALELKIRWTAIASLSETVYPIPGTVIGLAVMQHDNDGRGRRQASVEWAAVPLNAVYNTPSYLGKATLLAGNRLKLEAKNNITGVENPIRYNSSICEDLLCDVDGLKDSFYYGLTGPDDGFLQRRFYAHNDNGRPADDADLSAKIWTAWDDRWLYLYEEVRDDTLGANAANAWEEDCLELNFDPRPASAANSIWGIRLTALDRTTPGVVADDNLNNVPSGSKYFKRRTIPGGYALELAIRWSAVVSGTETVAPAAGTVFGMAINQHDNDGRGRRQATVQWAAVLLDAARNTPAYFGTVTFRTGNKLQFTARNAFTGSANPIPYDGSDYPPNGVAAGDAIPSGCRLGLNYPNPFNPSTRISYVLPSAGETTLVILDLMGRKIRTLRNGASPAGSFTVLWDGLDDRGNPAGSGIYLTVLKHGKTTAGRKMMKIE
jgi:hypothetical protein